MCKTERKRETVNKRQILRYRERRHTGPVEAAKTGYTLQLDYYTHPQITSLYMFNMIVTLSLTWAQFRALTLCQLRLELQYQQGYVASCKMR